MDTKRQITAFFNRLDRSQFLDNEYKEMADINRPLPIGFDQTISQPSLVLEMTIQLALDKSCKVLEIGTGSGYQTAFLAEFAETVYTVERIEALSESAALRLEKLGYRNIYYRVGDGSEGWIAHMPYDRIMVTAAAARMPDKLLEQLRPGGIAIIPVGPAGYQDLLKIRKDQTGHLHTESLAKVTFVALKGAYEWD